MDNQIQDRHHSSLKIHLLHGYGYPKDVHLHRRPSSGSASFLQTCFHGLNALLGAGVLALPYAVASGGWLSLVFLFIIAASTFYTALLIQRCMDMDSTIKTYPDIGDRAFGSGGRALLSLATIVELFMVATGLLIFEGDNLHKMFPGFQVDVRLAGMTSAVSFGGKQCLVVIVSLLVLPTVWLNDLRVLSYVSATGVAASFVLLASMLWMFAFGGGDGGTDGGGEDNGKSLMNWGGAPTAVSLFAFGYGAHPVFPMLYTSMKNPNQFSKVLLVCFAIATASYASMAILGYLMFGSHTLSQVTLNLPTENLSSKIAIYTTMVNPIAKYALLVIPIVKAIERSVDEDGDYCSKKRLLLITMQRVLVRTSVVISTVIVAIAVPFFGYLMALVGALMNMTVSIIMPCLCFLKICRIYGRLRFGEVIVICWIVVIGVGIMIVGTYTAIMQIITHF